MKIIKSIHGTTLWIITDKQGNEYVLQMFVIGSDYLIPYNRSKYWEHCFVPKKTWIAMENVKYDNYDITKEEYQKIKIESNKKCSEILEKYHASF